MAFTLDERRRLLATPRLGPVVIDRLELLGIDSFDKLRQVGVDAAVERVCQSLGSRAWANRRKPLALALSQR
jgi:hypothetical protein